MREWSEALAKEDTTLKHIEDGISAANSKIKVLKTTKCLLPSWAIYVTLPIGIASTILAGPAGAIIGGTLLGLDGISCAGRLLWAGVTRLPNGLLPSWYLLDQRS